jgi:hypothetical protein
VWSGNRLSTRQDGQGHLERVKRLWVEIAKTLGKSPGYQGLVDEIHAASVAYLAGLDADRSVARRRIGADRRQNDADVRGRRVDRRQFADRRVGPQTVPLSL